MTRKFAAGGLSAGTALLWPAIPFHPGGVIAITFKMAYSRLSLSGAAKS